MKADNENTENKKDNKLIIFVIGVLVGAIISTASFLICVNTIGANNNSNNSSSQSSQMQGGPNGQTGTPPEMPSGQNGQMGTPPEKPGENNNSQSNN